MNELYAGRSLMGKSLAKKINYKKLRGGTVLYEQVYSLLEEFVTADHIVWPAVPEYEYKRYTLEKVQERATAFLTSIEQCSTLTMLNTVVANDANCDIWNCTGEFSEPVEPQKRIEAIGYNREVFLDFGGGTLIRTTQNL